MSNLVSGGYGQPESGALVAGGFGAATPAAPGGLSATLVGQGVVTASLSATQMSVPGSPHPGYGLDVAFTPRRRVRVAMSANLSGSSHVMAALSSSDWTAIYDFNNSVLLELV